MQSHQHLFFSDPYVQKLIRRKAREMARRFGLCKADQDDIEQELRLDVLQRSKSYDRAKSGVSTFCNRIIAHRIASMIGERQAQCRDWTRLVSLQDPLPGGEHGLTWEDCMDSGGNMGSALPIFSPEHQAADLRMDISRLLDMLSPFQKMFCLRLQTHTVAEIAAETGIPASTLYDMRRKLRRLFRVLQDNSSPNP